MLKTSCTTAIYNSITHYFLNDFNYNNYKEECTNVSVKEPDSSNPSIPSVIKRERRFRIFPDIAFNDRRRLFFFSKLAEYAV
jgi:hypothetical protein